MLLPLTLLSLLVCPVFVALVLFFLALKLGTPFYR